MYNWFKSLLHSIILPRGKQFKFDENLSSDWNREMFSMNKRTLHILYKEVPNATQTVILAHPYLADAHQFFLKRGYPDIYFELGCNVVLFDFNGFGRSPFDGFSYEKDWAMAANFATLQFPATKLIGHGISFGGSNTITYATLNPQGVSKFIVENTLDSNLSYYKKRNIKLYRLMIGLMKLSNKINANHDFVKASARMKHSGVLFIYNDEDDLTTLAMGQQLFESCPEPKSLTVFHGKHLEAYPNSPDLYRQTIRNFIFG